jgi:hypothetical protein
MVADHHRNAFKMTYANIGRTPIFAYYSLD